MEFTFKDRHGFKQMTAEELVTLIEKRFAVAGLRDWFFFNGKPFNGASIVDIDDQQLILFKMSRNSLYSNAAYKFWDGVERPRAYIDANEIAGYELVDACFNGRYCGTFINIVTK